MRKFKYYKATLDYFQGSTSQIKDVCPGIIRFYQSVQIKIINSLVQLGHCTKESGGSLMFIGALDSLILIQISSEHFVLKSVHSARIEQVCLNGLMISS